ncbi:MAG: glycoside hydrolase family 127 protein, partial [Phycisphaerae bacterium]|nr:glycoside hydrolase family 127 protein [Phycisphaerae bacterium]
ETGDPAFWSSTLSIWDNLVNRKLYVTGGIGSGETSEGFGGDYSLPSQSAYCESCSSCGMIFFQHNLNLATRSAMYADLYETTLYNALLGAVDLPAKHFTYTNSLDSSEGRYLWHTCPCCVGNIPRTLLMLPTWMYSKSGDELYVNLFVGSTINVGKVAGLDVQVVQSTNYPWDGKVTMTVNPASESHFAIHIRSPRRQVSTLYTATPDSDGILSMSVNGQAVDVQPDADGYVVINRTWKPGDQIMFEVPIKVQQIRATDKIVSTRGRVALARGPLIYNIESVDQNVDKPLDDKSELLTDWKPDMLEGIMAIHGRFADGSTLLAIPNYARLNRGGRSLVWMKQ